MPYVWEGSGPLRRSGRTGDTLIEEGETFEPTEAERSAFGDLMREVEATSSPVEPPEEEDETPLEKKDYSDLRQMAVEADTDEIDGRSSKEEIVSYFAEE